MEPSSPGEVFRHLCAVFPTFQKWWKDGEQEPLDTELGFHRIMAEFIQFFGANHHSFSEKQLRRFGEWVNASVLIDGPLENAISTCFLEHTRQVKINRILAPYLSRVAKDKSHA